MGIRGEKIRANPITDRIFLVILQRKASKLATS